MNQKQNSRLNEAIANGLSFVFAAFALIGFVLAMTAFEGCGSMMAVDEPLIFWGRLCGGLILMGISAGSVAFMQSRI